MNKRLVLVFSILMSSITGQAYSEDQQGSKLISEISEAKAKKRVHPQFPDSAARNGQEGWALASFVIEEDGSVSNVIIEDSSGIKGFERETKKAIKRWEYEPAMRDGKPVQQCESQVMMYFKLENSRPALTRSFRNKSNKTKKALSEGDLKTASSMLDELKEKPKWNFTEDTYYWLLQSEYHKADNDPKGQLAALSRVRRSMGSILEDTQQVAVLQQLLALQLNEGKWANAKNTFNRLKEYEGTEEVLKQFTPYVEKMDMLIQSEERIVTNGEISDRNHWSHELVRDKFALVNITGTLDRVDVRCNNKRTVFTASEGVVLDIPDQWGACRIFVEGETGADFQLIELPFNYEAT